MVGWREAVDDLAGGGGFGQAGFGLGEGGGEPLDLLAQVVDSCNGVIVFGLQQPQEFADVHAASSTSSRQVGEGGEAAEHAGGGGPVVAGCRVVGSVVVVAGEAPVQHEGAVDLLDHPPLRLRDEALAFVAGVAADHLDGDALHCPVDDHGVLDALVDQGFLQAHPASLGCLVQQGNAGLVSCALAARTITPMTRPHTSTASPRFLPGVFLFTSGPVVFFGTPAATRTYWVSMITRDGSSDRPDLSRTWQRRISWIRWPRPSWRHRLK